MKKNYRIFMCPLALIVACLLLTSSCKKGDNNTNNPASTSLKKLKTINYSNGQGKVYEYNSDGKLAKYTSTDGSFFINYIYSGNIITATSHSAGKTYNAVYTLNSQGYITNGTGLDEMGVSFVDTYEYDDLGYCTKNVFTETNYIVIFTYTYLNGNITSNTRSENGQIQTWTYEYYLDKENKMGYGDPIQNCFGKHSKNLIKKGIAPWGTYTYTYDFDKDNYVTKQTEIASDGSISWWTTYSYI